MYVFHHQQQVQWTGCYYYYYYLLLLLITSAGSQPIVVTLTCSGRVFLPYLWQKWTDPNQTWQKETTSQWESTRKFGCQSYSWHPTQQSCAVFVCSCVIRKRLQISVLNHVILLLIYAHRKKKLAFLHVGGGDRKSRIFVISGVRSLPSVYLEMSDLPKLKKNFGSKNLFTVASPTLKKFTDFNCTIIFEIWQKMEAILEWADRKISIH